MNARDQADGLRRMLAARAPRVVSFASCIERAGRTTLVAQLAAQLAREGREVWILDGSSFAGNVCEVFGLRPKRELAHVLHGEARLEEVLLQGPDGVRVLPATRALRDFSFKEFNFEKAGEKPDFILVDAARRHIPAGGEVIVATTGQPAALTETWGWMKSRAKALAEAGASLLVCRAGEREARTVHANLSALALSRAGFSLGFLKDIAAWANTQPPQITKRTQLREAAA